MTSRAALILLFASLPFAATALPAPPRADALIDKFTEAFEGKPKKNKKKTATSGKSAKVPLPKPRPDVLTAKPAAGAEAGTKDDTDKPAEADAAPKPEETAKVPLPEPRPDALAAKPAPAAEAEPKNDEPPAAEAEKNDPPKGDTAKNDTASAEPETEEMAEVPFPQPRPKDLKTDFGPTAPPPGLVEAEVPADPIPDPLCDELEKQAEIEFERLPRIMQGQCNVLTPIRLKAFTPKDGPKVTLEQPATVTCKVAATALDWLKTSVQPAAIKHLGGTIRAWRQTGGYECRGRNGDPSGKLSEHGSANALDIGGFERMNGVVVPVSDKGEAELGFLNDIRKAACGPFTTVLGPGVSAHEEHFHLDLAKRGKDGRTTYCR